MVMLRRLRVRRRSINTTIKPKAAKHGGSILNKRDGFKNLVFTCPSNQVKLSLPTKRVTIAYIISICSFGATVRPTGGT